MRFVFATLGLALGTTAAVCAQTTPAPVTASPAPSAAPSDGPNASACTPRRANLGGIGQASVVAFTGAVFGDRVCATVANVAIDGFTARIAGAAASSTGAPASDEALVTATLGEGGSVTFALDGATVSNVGPYVVEPGGRFPQLSGDVAAQPRAVLAYAGQRVLVIGFTAVTLPDLVRVLRDQPDLFGADAVERAVVLSSGRGAGVLLNASGGPMGASGDSSQRILQLIKRV
jgi:hypothetical protein